MPAEGRSINTRPPLKGNFSLCAMGEMKRRVLSIFLVVVATGLLVVSFDNPFEKIVAKNADDSDAHKEQWIEWE